MMAMLLLKGLFKGVPAKLSGMSNQTGKSCFYNKKLVRLTIIIFLVIVIIQTLYDSFMTNFVK